MTGPVTGPVWDEERNGWQHPDGVLVPAEIVGGRDLPDQAGRAEPFGIAYEVDDETVDYACTCDVEAQRLHDGTLFAVDRHPDPTDPCPLKGHDRPERHRHA